MFLDLAIIPLFIFVFLSIVYSAEGVFFANACLYITIIGILLLTFIPMIVIPLFYKYESINSDNISQDLTHLAYEVSFPLNKVEVVDGSSRTNHSNAFFYGLGRNKNIVLFDTLL